MKKIKIFCVNLDREIEVDGGTSLSELYPSLDLGFEPYVARVNNRTEGMHYMVYRPKTIEFIPADTPAGRSAYVRSLCMLLYAAVRHTVPGAHLHIQHSMQRGYYCTLDTDDGYLDISRQTLDALMAEMWRMVEADMPFEHFEAPTAKVIEIFRREDLRSKVLLLETLHEPYTVYYRLGDVHDSYYGTLLARTGLLRTFKLVRYKKGFLLLASRQAIESPDLPQEKMYKAFTHYVEFNHILGISNAGQINHMIQHRRAADLINVAEAIHNKYLAQIADEITSRYRKGGARVVLVAGPSSSGKTTTTKRLAIQLMANLLKPQIISLDDYFVNRVDTPLDEFGEYDFENIHAVDLPLFNSDLNRILAGEEVALPTYNFETGRREYRGNTAKLVPGGILLLEGIHGLNPELTAAVDEKMKFRVYVSALTTLTIDSHNWVPTTDTRLLRRIIRDYKYRGFSAVETIRLWPSVRRGEEKWIFPYQENADATFNSSLVFELSVLRKHGELILEQVRSDVPEYADAYRLRRLLQHFTPMPDDCIPPTSLLREFVGGSSFHY